MLVRKKTHLAALACIKELEAENEALKSRQPEDNYREVATPLPPAVTDKLIDAARGHIFDKFSELFAEQFIQIAFKILSKDGPNKYRYLSTYGDIAESSFGDTVKEYRASIHVELRTDGLTFVI